MAKEFAKGFYNSKEWKKCREAYIQSVFGLCERCGKPGYIVHHKQYLRPENMNNMGVLTGFDNLEYLCLDCHNEEHHRQEVAMRNKYYFDADGNIFPHAPHKKC